MAMTVHDWLFWHEGADGPDYSQSLYELARYFKCKRGLEIGVRFGKSALPFLLANKDATLVGIDPNPEFPIEEFMKEQGVADRFHFVRGYSPGAVAQFKDQKFDWIYIDGRHDYDGVLADYEATKDMVAPGGIMVFDDMDKTLGYGTDVADVLADLGLEYKTNEDFGLTPNPHKAGIICY